MDTSLTKRLLHAGTLSLSRGLTQGFMHPRIKPQTTNCQCIGPAFTVRAPGRDAAAVYQAVSQAPAGSILVIDRGHDTIFAAVDEQVVLIAKARGLHGIVIDGCIGNSQAIKFLDFPVFATGISPAGCVCLGLSGSLQVTVSCGDVPVADGQMLIADADGVLVLPADFQQLLNSAEQEIKTTQQLKAQIKEGKKELYYMNLDVAAFVHDKPNQIIANIKKQCPCKK